MIGGILNNSETKRIDVRDEVAERKIPVTFTISKRIKKKDIAPPILKFSVISPKFQVREELK